MLFRSNMVDCVFFGRVPHRRKNSGAGDGLKAFRADEPARGLGHDRSDGGPGGGQLTGQIDGLVSGDSAGNSKNYFSGKHDNCESGTRLRALVRFVTF